MNFRFFSFSRNVPVETCVIAAQTVGDSARARELNDFDVPSQVDVQHCFSRLAVFKPMRRKNSSPWCPPSHGIRHGGPKRSRPIHREKCAPAVQVRRIREPQVQVASSDVQARRALPVRFFRANQEVPSLSRAR